MADTWQWQFGSYLPSFIRNGYSGRQAMGELRDNGFAFSNQMFWRAWGETQHFLATHEDMPPVNLRRRPTAEQIITTTRPKARGYYYPVNIASHDPETGEVSFHAWGVKSQRLVSWQTALQLAISSWAESQQSGRGTPPGNAIGAIPEPVQLFVGPEDTLTDGIE